MSSWLAWSIVVLVWSTLLSFLTHTWEYQGWFYVSTLLMALSIISCLVYGTAEFLRWQQAWPFIPQ